MVTLFGKKSIRFKSNMGVVAVKEMFADITWTGFITIPYMNFMDFCITGV